MKTIKLLFIISLLTVSCEKLEIKTFVGDKLILRQLTTVVETKNVVRGSYFLVAGSYSEDKSTETTVKVFAEVSGRYRVVEIPIKKLRVVINNKIKKPHLELEYTSKAQQSDEYLLSKTYHIDSFIITCPEEYLPENLIPINL